MEEGITISCGGKGSADFAGQLTAAGIEYTTFERKPNAYAAAGDILSIDGDAAPYTALANVLVAWVRARVSRSIIITTKDDKIVHAKRHSIEEVEKLLDVTSRITVIDPVKPLPAPYPAADSCGASSCW